MLKDYPIPGNLKGTIIFIHGISSSSEVFKDIMNSKEIQFSKISFDLPGHGKAYGYQEDFSLLSYKKALVSYISIIQEDIILVGNSFGGHLAIEIADQLKNLKALVIFGTPPLKKPVNFGEAFIPIEALQTFFKENPSEKEIIKASKIAVFNPKHSERIIVDFKRSNPDVRRSLALDLEEGNWANQYKIFKTLSIPKFIVKGKQDPTVNSKYLDSICATDQNCTIFEFDQCGHYPSLEKPNEFIDTIKFISEKVLL
ncbi:alpha/beta fold hydrolase [Aquimarina sp. Aq107]|uniref:alpha/beta fold hydrolase n=1 Tax=Aquimarina sp. Aq107 TaxID=1191912 RepID=UPI000D55747F|nr:alpha/beta hydrolase [Aquimarina sp. Aq107]